MNNFITQELIAIQTVSLFEFYFCNMRIKINNNSTTMNIQFDMLKLIN